MDRSSSFAAMRAVGSSTLRLRGDLEENHLGELTDHLRVLEESGGVVDLSGVTFLTSRAVGQLAVARRRAAAHGVELRLVARPGSVAASVLRVAGLDDDTA